MAESQFKPGDEVNLKNNRSVIYIYLSDDGTKAKCIDPNNRETFIYLVALEKHEPFSIM